MRQVKVSAALTIAGAAIVPAAPASASLVKSRRRIEALHSVVLATCEAMGASDVPWHARLLPTDFPWFFAPRRCRCLIGRRLPTSWSVPKVKSTRGLLGAGLRAH